MKTSKKLTFMVAFKKWHISCPVMVPHVVSPHVLSGVEVGGSDN